MALLRHGTGETDTAFADERLARSGPPEQPYTQLPPSTLRSDIDPKAAAAIVDALLAPQVFTRLVNDAGWSLDDYKRWVLDLIQYAILRDAN